MKSEFEGESVSEGEKFAHQILMIEEFWGVPLCRSLQQLVVPHGTFFPASVCVCCSGVWENTCSGTAVATGISGKIMETESHCANSNLIPHISLPSVSPSLSFCIIDKTSGENTVHLVELWFRCACYLLSRSNPPPPPHPPTSVSP